MQEAEKLIKLVISELRKALKLKLNFGDAALPENFLSLIQVEPKTSNKMTSTNTKSCCCKPLGVYFSAV